MTRRIDDTPQEAHFDYPSEQLRSALEGPIVLDLAAYSQDRIAPPTPLDPDGVFIDPNTGWDYSVGYQPQPSSEHYTFRDFIHESRTRAISFAGKGLLPDSLVEFLDVETGRQTENRISHNVAALERLKAAVIARPPKDDAMLDIIQQARAGMASLPEMVRLLKEYPEMISIETSNYRGVLNSESHGRALHEALLMVPYLRDNFHDARVTPSLQVSYSDSSLVSAVRVKKQVLADIESIDSHTQLVLKVPIITAGSRAFELGVTTYLRVFDRKNRAGYAVEPDEVDIEDALDLPPDEARRLIGEIAAANVDSTTLP